MADEIKFASTTVHVDNELVAKITAFNRNVSVKEEDVTGSADIVSGTDVLQEQYVSISVGETATVEGIAIESADTGRDDGQSDLKTAAEEGQSVVLKHTRPTGYGSSLTGFFTSYEETGDKSGVYKFKATFRINSKTAITPAS